MSHQLQPTRQPARRMNTALRPPWQPSPWMEWKVSTTGSVTFGAWNGENIAFAFCPVKQTGWNAEHSCVGGNGSTCGNGCGGWGNMREWYYDGNWCMSTKIRTAALMMLVR